MKDMEYLLEGMKKCPKIYCGDGACIYEKHWIVNFGWIISHELCFDKAVKQMFALGMVV